MSDAVGHWPRCWQRARSRERPRFVPPSFALGVTTGMLGEPRLCASELAALIAERLIAQQEALAAAFVGEGIRCCYLDRVLPDAVVRSLARQLPPVSGMIRRRSLKERKFVSARMDSFAPELAELVLAFNDPRVVAAVATLTGMNGIAADGELYNGGITTMVQRDFMYPHLDNSHDRSGHRKRRIVLLYYLTPDWQPRDGGHLELWSDRCSDRARIVEYRFGRLVMMETTEHSWHAVGPVVGERLRANLTCYYYDAPTPAPQAVRLTRYRTSSNEKLRGLLFEVDYLLRTWGNRVGLRRLISNRHRFHGLRNSAPQSGRIDG